MQADVNLTFVIFTSAFITSVYFAIWSAHFLNELAVKIKEEMNFNILTLMFLSNLQISLNQRMMMNSFSLLFNVVIDSFQLFIIKISNHNIDALSIQACIMCIKYVWIFHIKEMIYIYNAIFHEKMMYKCCNRCANKKIKCIVINTFINYAS
jgi:hypothetical protein